MAQYPIHSESNDDMTQDYRNLRGIMNNSNNIKCFELKCQEIIHNKLILNRDYFKSSKNFLVIIKLLNLAVEDRKKLLSSLQQLKNYDRYSDNLTEEEREELKKDIRNLIELNEIKNVYFTTSYLMELSGYLYTKRFKFNCSKLYQLILKQDLIWENRVDYIQKEVSTYDDSERVQNSTDL
ncbi:uncharacterized protein RJT20DRAFT_54857 [Scheffersomyces xylosifermentans]|uniref:uncharacterized protein n=1 Tax=Scheffersomyces xylosifermentans TaxID=1304137 RepID=UPI00315D623E